MSSCTIQLMAVEERIGSREHRLVDPVAASSHRAIDSADRGVSSRRTRRTYHRRRAPSCRSRRARGETAERSAQARACRVAPRDRVGEVAVELRVREQRRGVAGPVRAPSVAASPLPVSPRPRADRRARTRDRTRPAFQARGASASEHPHERDTDAIRRGHRRERRMLRRGDVEIRGDRRQHAAPTRETSPHRRTSRCPSSAGASREIAASCRTRGGRRGPSATSASSSPTIAEDPRRGVCAPRRIAAGGGGGATTRSASG